MSFLEKKILIRTTLLATAAALTIPLVSVFNRRILITSSSDSNYNLHLDSNTNINYLEGTYVYNPYQTLSFSSITESEGNVGVLSAGSTITLSNAINGLSNIVAIFTGGDLVAYTSFLENDPGATIRYDLSSGIETTVTGNYVTFEIGDSDITLSSLDINYGCDVETIKPTNPNDLIEFGSSLKIEAENGYFIDPSSSIYADTEGKSIEATNNPSGDKFVRGLNNCDKGRTFLNYFINSNRAGLAVLNLCFGLNTLRSLGDMYDVQLNGETLTIYDSSIVCPAYTKTRYYEWTEIPGYLLNLKQGQNTLTLTVKEGGLPLNFDYLLLKSDCSLSEITPKYNYYDVLADSSHTASKSSYTKANSTTPGYYGSTTKQTFDFQVSVSTDTTARVYFKFGHNGYSEYFSKQFTSFLVDGSSEDVIICDNEFMFTDWTNFFEVSFTIVKLSSGTHTVSLTFNETSNFAGIAFVSTSTVSMHQAFRANDGLNLWSKDEVNGASFIDGDSNHCSLDNTGNVMFYKNTRNCTFTTVIEASEDTTVDLYLWWYGNSGNNPINTLVSSLTLNGVDQTRYNTPTTSTGWSTGDAVGVENAILNNTKLLATLNLTAGTNTITFVRNGSNINLAGLGFVSDVSLTLSTVIS